MANSTRLTELFRALGNPHRLKLLELVAVAERNQKKEREKEKKPRIDEEECVGLATPEIVENMDLSQSIVFQHLRILEHAGFLTSERHNRFTYYRLDTLGFRTVHRVIARYYRSAAKAAMNEIPEGGDDGLAYLWPVDD